jgi:hypothetical protein
MAKISPLPIFKMAYGNDLSEITQFAIDFAFFGLATREDLFNITVPLFSKDYHRNRRKAKMTRFLLMPAGPIDFKGVRYKNVYDQSSSQEYFIANWQVDLNKKLVKLEIDYPEFKIYSFGRAYAYRFFYR